MNKLWILFKRNCAGSLQVGKKNSEKVQKTENRKYFQ